MKIVFVTQEESLFLAPMLDRVFTELKGHELRVMLFRDTRQPRVRKFMELAHKFGPAYTFRTGWDYALRMAGTALERRGVRVFGTAPSISALARRHGIPSHTEFEKINTPECVEFLRSHSPDLLVSVACPQILRRRVLEIPRLGAINVHGGPLPRYRGMHSAFWQLFHGETECATTVHYMTEGVDAGPILRQEPWRIDPGDTLHDVIARSKTAGARALVQAIRDIEAGRATTKPNPDEEATVFTEPTRDEVREFRRRGKALR
jgi:methionyl-tRNA formyltransferase